MKDALERALHGIRDFADEALEGSRRWRPDHGASSVQGGGAHPLEDFLDEVGSGPVREIWAAHPEEKGFHSGLVHRRVRVVPRDVATLLTEPAALALASWERKLLRQGRQRVTRQELPASLLLGESAGLIMATDRSQQERVLLVRDRDVLGLLTRLFRTLWAGAIDLELFLGRGGDTGEENIHHLVLLCLSQGLKDEAAARELDMSVRTYRRHVADLLRKLGATSRFQAGFQAAVRGLEPGSLDDVGLNELSGRSAGTRNPR
ncbi:helix-turn-helix transcriptional regulator [Nocardiopsis sp. CA-288880]|uniref:helix-turn-helix transcriptional regulator n=1 Tax=Nocardiopsis sp. CA-288880 TaxID=3239995 RepID=UPI003D95BB56